MQWSYSLSWCLLQYALAMTFWLTQRPVSKLLKAHKASAIATASPLCRAQEQRGSYSPRLRSRRSYYIKVAEPGASQLHFHHI
ncbi:MAG: hypothetical protein NXY57DRAFT_83504 [Lentinula lateritia]|nr:MAG: hypothetical protein NXY57DRAFT_83504 [Lentinula lateritia]